MEGMGGFSGTVHAAQGGASFGMLGSSPGSDMLPTHPKSSKSTQNKKIKWAIKYRQFDLSDNRAVEELEDILTDIANDQHTHRLRHERLANGADGMTIVTLSWAVGAEIKVEKPELRVDEDGNPYKLQQQYPYTTIKDGEHPGQGMAMGPPGKSQVESTKEAGHAIQDAFDAEPGDTDA